MSHTVCSKALIADLDCLEKTLAKIPGAKLGPLQTHNNGGEGSYRLITIPGASHNGYVQKEADGTWRLKWDSDDHVLNQTFGKEGEKFMIEYAEEVCRKHAEQTGATFEKTDVDEDTFRIELVQVTA